MPKLAKGRDAYLTREEIARETLHQFEVSPRPFSMRGLARALGVSAPTIYHYFPTEAQVIRAAVRLVFAEAVNDYKARVGDPVTAPLDGEDLLVQSAVSFRRAALRHFRIVRHLAVSPEAPSNLSGMMAIYGAAFEQLGIDAARVGEAAFAYSCYVYGSVFVSASRLESDELLSESLTRISPADTLQADAQEWAAETKFAVDEVLSVTPALDDEDLFVKGLSMLIAGMRLPSDETAQRQLRLRGGDRHTHVALIKAT